MLFTFVIIRGLLEQDRIFNCFVFVFYIYFVVGDPIIKKKILLAVLTPPHVSRGSLSFC